MQHVSRARDAGDLDAREYRAKRLRRCRPAPKLRQELGLLAHQHQQRRRDAAPARFRIFALVQNRIHPVMARIAQQVHPPVGIESTPGLGHERDCAAREARITEADDGGQLLE